MSNLTSAARANLILAPTGILLAVLSSTLIARWLGPETFADYATLTSLLAWVLLLAESGCNIGLGRYLQEARPLQAEGTLYQTLLYRRWAIAAFWTLLLVLAGPWWATYTGLPPLRWQADTFFLIGMLSAVMLHSQLANNALISAFLHKKMLMLSQIMMGGRAVTLIIIAGSLKNPVHLILALLVLASVEAALMHLYAKKSFAGQYRPLPKGMATATQIHGLVSQFDKLTTALSGGSFLILVLTGSQGRTELAMLAVATDLLQKLLGVISLPLSNIILPMLNDSRHDKERFHRQVARLGGLTTVLFSIACGGVAVATLSGLPLLLGAAYTPAVALALIWLPPLFVEAAARMVWGTAILTLDHRGWLMKYNTAFGLVTLLVLVAAHSQPIESLLALLGGVRLVMSGLLLCKAMKLGLLTRESFPLGIIAVSTIGCFLALYAQTKIDPQHAMIRLLLGGSLYAVLILAALRFLRLVPRLARDTLCHLAGKFCPVITFFIPAPLKD